MPHRTLADQVCGGFPGAVRTPDPVARLADRCAEHGFLTSSSLLIAGGSASCGASTRHPTRERAVALDGA